MANFLEQLQQSLQQLDNRVKRLEQEGYIEGYYAKLSEAKLNQSLLAHVQVSLVTSNTSVFKVFREYILNIPQ